MAQPETTTVILPINLGAASKYNKEIFPRAYHNAGNAVDRGSLLLSATLEEMVKIVEMGVDLNTDQRFRFNARVQYEMLTAKEAALQDRPKTLNPFTMFRYYRAARMFHAASKSLFIEAKRTTDSIQREVKLMRAVPSRELRAVQDSSPQEAVLDGIAVTLPGALDEDAQQKILAAAHAIALHASASDPFVDNPQIPQLSDDDSIITLADTASLLTQETPSSNPDPPSSPISYNFYILNSSVHGMTLNHGSRNRGSTS